MTNRNSIIYAVRSIIGEEKTSGFFTPVRNQGEVIEVPNFLFKDAPAEYPEIRISPFISDAKVVTDQHIYCQNSFKKIYTYRTKFQVDIYATTIPLVNNIYDEVYRRIDKFHDFDMITYGYNKSFEQIDENVFYSKIYNSHNFNIFRILINNNLIMRVDNIDSLHNNTYIINEDGLTIRTTLPIQNIKIQHNINGLQFKDDTTQYQNQIINTTISDKRMLSELEKNSVERITFDLNILYQIVEERCFGPILDDISIE